MFTNIKINIEDDKFVGVSCDINSLPSGIPRALDNMDYQGILDEIIANGTDNFAEGETIPDELQKDVDNKKGIK